MRLDGKRMIVTGGSSGLGQAIAIAFAKAGADIVFSYQHNQAGAEQTGEMLTQLGRKNCAIAVCLQDIDALNAFFDQAITFLGGIDGLVNNAGTLTRHANFMKISLAEYDLVQAVNLRAPFVLTQLAARRMMTQGTGGSILNISSISATVASPGLMHYECSKAALNRLTQSAACELAPYHIRVNAIAPGLFATNLNVEQRTSNSTLWQQRCERIPLQQVGVPENITALALLLASDAGALITGEIIAIDGGVSINRITA